MCVKFVTSESVINIINSTYIVNEQLVYSVVVSPTEIVYFINSRHLCMHDLIIIFNKNGSFVYKHHEIRICPSRDNPGIVRIPGIQRYSDKGGRAVSIPG